ncbi:4906_t:CDS:2, partial [Scutellospora calospora]
MALYQQYSGFKKSFEQSTEDEKRYKKYIIMLNEMANDGLIVGEVLDTVVKKYNGFVNDKVSFESYIKAFEFREYALCVLFNSSKNIYISSRHEIPGADYNGKYQVTGGKMRRLRDEGRLTRTLGTKLDEIVAHINNYLKAKKRRLPKKRKFIEEKNNNENNSESPKETVNEVVENCDVMNCDGESCDDINNNSINHTTVTTEEEIEEEILNI